MQAVLLSSGMVHCNGKAYVDGQTALYYRLEPANAFLGRSCDQRSRIPNTDELLKPSTLLGNHAMGRLPKSCGVSQRVCPKCFWHGAWPGESVPSKTRPPQLLASEKRMKVCPIAQVLPQILRSAPWMPGALPLILGGPGR